MIFTLIITMITAQRSSPSYKTLYLIIIFIIITSIFNNIFISFFDRFIFVKKHWVLHGVDFIFGADLVVKSFLAKICLSYSSTLILGCSSVCLYETQVKMYILHFKIIFGGTYFIDQKYD